MLHSNNCFLSLFFYFPEFTSFVSLQTLNSSSSDGLFVFLCKAVPPQFLTLLLYPRTCLLQFSAYLCHYLPHLYIKLLPSVETYCSIVYLKKHGFVFLTSSLVTIALPCSFLKQKSLKSCQYQFFYFHFILNWFLPSLLHKNFSLRPPLTSMLLNWILNFHSQFM